MFIQLDRKADPDKRVDALVEKHAATQADLASIVSCLNDLDTGLQTIKDQIQTKADRSEIPVVPPPPEPPKPVDLSPIEKRLSQLEERNKESDMNEQQKQQLLQKQNDYWLENHADCFLNLPDGRKVLSNDLLTYKHDLLLKDIYTRLSKPIDIPPPQKINLWPMWLCIGALTVLEIVRVVL